MEHIPDIIISVHPFMQHVPIKVLKRQRLQKIVTFITVITDLNTCHRAWFVSRGQIRSSFSRPVLSIFFIRIQICSGSFGYFFMKIYPYKASSPKHFWMLQMKKKWTKLVRGDLTGSDPQFLDHYKLISNFQFVNCNPQSQYSLYNLHVGLFVFRFHPGVDRLYSPSEMVAKRALLDGLNESQIRVFALPIRPSFCRAIVCKVFFFFFKPSVV